MIDRIEGVIMRIADAVEDVAEMLLGLDQSHMQERPRIVDDHAEEATNWDEAEMPQATYPE